MEEEETDDEPTERPPPIGFLKAWLLPGVIAVRCHTPISKSYSTFNFQYSLAYACLKLVNYGFFFWLPYYLHAGLHWPESYADSLSTWYDVGGIVAAVLAGAFSDHMRSRTPVVFIMLLMATVSLYIYARKASIKCSNLSIRSFRFPRILQLECIPLTRRRIFHRRTGQHDLKLNYGRSRKM